MLNTFLFPNRTFLNCILNLNEENILIHRMNSMVNLMTLLVCLKIRYISCLFSCLTAEQMYAIMSLSRNRVVDNIAFTKSRKKRINNRKETKRYLAFNIIPAKDTKVSQDCDL